MRIEAPLEDIALHDHGVGELALCGSLGLGSDVDDQGAPDPAVGRSARWGDGAWSAGCCLCRLVDHDGVGLVRSVRAPLGGRVITRVRHVEAERIALEEHVGLVPARVALLELSEPG
jgi:hypothetical protein